MTDIGLLLLRVGFGGMMILSHGWDKLSSFSDKMGTFPDPIGVGSTMSLTLAVFAEFFCAIALVLGILTRWAAAPLFVTVFIAATVVHAQDPFRVKELAVAYSIVFLTLICVGGGRFSFDRMVLKRN